MTAYQILMGWLILNGLVAAMALLRAMAQADKQSRQERELVER